MIAPERRTRGDLVAVAVIAVAALLAAGLLWQRGDANATVSERAVGPPPAELEEPTTLPPSLAQAWSAPSGATAVPLVAGSTVVTADGGEVVGHDPVTGEQRWSYRRDIPLCAALSAFGAAVTAWSKDPRYCSEVTSLDGDTGKRARQRNGDSRRDSRLLTDGTHVTALGGEYLETWRFDLVRTTQYGSVPAVVNPGKQPRSGCRYLSGASAAGRIALVERCPGDAGDRLTVLKASPKEAELPEVVVSTDLRGPASLVITLSATRVAVLLPGPTRIAVFDDTGAVLAESPVQAVLPSGDGPAVAATTATDQALYWFTGSSTVALDLTEFRPLWTRAGTLGPGTRHAGRLLVPAAGRLDVLDPATGEELGSTPVDRGTWTGPVRVGSAGSVILEQRGPQLVALR